jgi:hypothetical protein
MANKHQDPIYELYRWGRKNKKHEFTTYLSFLEHHRLKWQSKKNSSESKGIEFKISFEDWMLLWDKKIFDRGSDVHQYNICRITEPGPYTLENVYIGHPKDNARDRMRNGNQKIRTRHVRVNGIEYSSVKEAKQTLGVTKSKEWLQLNPEYLNYEIKIYQKN